MEPVEIQTGLLTIGSGRTFNSDLSTFERLMGKVVVNNGCWENLEVAE